MCEVKVEFLLKERILFMKTKFKLTALVGALLMSLSACDWGILGPVTKTSKLENYPATYNPYKLATKHDKFTKEEVSYYDDDKHYSFWDNTMVFQKEIAAIKHYDYVETNGTKSNKYFHLHIYFPGILFGENSERMTIYDDGYIDVQSRSSKAPLKNYYYKFNETDAQRLYARFEKLCKEEDERKADEQNARNEAQALLNQIDIDALLTYFGNNAPLEINLYHFNEPYPDEDTFDTRFNVDSSFVDELKVITYTETSSPYEGHNYDYVFYTSGKMENGISYSFTFDANELIASISLNIIDRCNYRHEKIINYKFSRAEGQALMNKCYELRNAYVESHPND